MSGGPAATINRWISCLCLLSTWLKSEVSNFGPRAKFGPQCNYIWPWKLACQVRIHISQQLVAETHQSFANKIHKEEDKEDFFNNYQRWPLSQF